MPKVGSVCYFSVVELVDGLQISSVSSTQSDSLTRTSVIIILAHSDLRMIIQTVWPQPQALSSIKSGGKSLVYNIHRESCQLPVPESGDTNQKCMWYWCVWHCHTNCRLGTGCARTECMYTSNLIRRGEKWHGINVSLSNGTSDPFHPTVKVSAWVKPQKCVRLRSLHFLLRGVMGLTSHWAVIQLNYWSERERAPPSEVA